MVILVAYRIIRVCVGKDSPAAPKSFNHLFLDQTVSLDDLNAMLSESLGLFGIRIASDSSDLEGLGLVLKQGLHHTAALRASGTKDSNELGRRHPFDLIGGIRV